MASRRKYLTQAEYAAYLSGGTTTDEAITNAEELIDEYVGFPDKDVKSVIEGKAASGGASTITLESARHQNTFQKNYFLYCVIEIIGGTGSGQIRTIASSTYEGVVTVDSAWDTAPDSTSYYKIYQLSKFPRSKDSFFDGNNSPQQYIKSIPEQVKRAVAAQVEYMAALGTAFFSGESSNFQSETIGDYSYSRGSAGNAGSNLIAPKAKQALKGFVNRKGVMIV